ncbi:MAG: Zn-dependent peptidase ImmA (M78 family) [Arenicella sp.]|jgi:Zn-dependent peptidase ImmA (M78 family)
MNETMIPKKPRYDVSTRLANGLTDIFTSPPIPVLEIAESNGVDVIFSDFGEHKDSVSGFCDFKNARLFVNKDESINRQTFTMAHELGHWLMHKELFIADPERYPVLLRSQSGDKNDPLEVEANNFAANLLVPSSLLISVKDFGSAKLASIFGVSLQMMEIRLKNV